MSSASGLGRAKLEELILGYTASRSVSMETQETEATGATFRDRTAFSGEEERSWTLLTSSQRSHVLFL